MSLVSFGVSAKRTVGLCFLFCGVGHWMLSSLSVSADCNFRFALRAFRFASWSFRLASCFLCSRACFLLISRTASVSVRGVVG